jgi:hypothetical protein
MYTLAPGDVVSMLSSSGRSCGRAICSKGLSAHQAYPSSTSSNKADIALDVEQVRDSELLGWHFVTLIRHDWQTKRLWMLDNGRYLYKLETNFMQNQIVIVVVL